MNTIIIEFENIGQEFTTWKVNQDGVVTDCQPLQKKVWLSTKVVNLKKLKSGGLVNLSLGGKVIELKCPIKNIKTA